MNTWERRHATGAVATITEVQADRFVVDVRSAEEGPRRWLPTQGSLRTAQQIADADTAHADCHACPPWTQIVPGVLTVPIDEVPLDEFDRGDDRS